MLLLNVLLGLAWLVLTSQYTALNFAAGLLLGYLALFLVARRGASGRYFQKVPLVIGFVLFFVWELILANLRVLRHVLGPLDRLRPAIIAVPLDIKSDAEITLLANLITLTPGTLSLDVSTDRRTLFVHAIHVDEVDAFILDIKNGFESQVRKVFT